MATTSTDREPVGILILDDAVFVRDCLRDLLADLPCVRVTASPASVVAALTLLRGSTVDVVILSPHHLDPSGATMVRAIKRAVPSARVIVTTSRQMESCQAERIASGADAYTPRANAYPRICALLSEWFQVDCSEDSGAEPGLSGTGAMG